MIGTIFFWLLFVATLVASPFIIRYAVEKLQPMVDEEFERVRAERLKAEQMSICGTPFFTNTIPSKEAVSRAELNALSSWRERSKRIEEERQQTLQALASRDEKLLALRGSFDALTSDFWREFGRGLGCEDPERVIATQKKRLWWLVFLGTIGLVAGVLLFGANLWLGVTACVTGLVVAAIVVIDSATRMIRAQRVAVILGREQNPFWLTAGSIALSNLAVTPPQGAQWWTPGQTTFVFARHIAPRWTIDALTGERIWENPLDFGTDPATRGLSASLAAQILKDLLTKNPRYRQLFNAFQVLACLENYLSDLQKLKAEADQGLAAELREAEPHEARRKAAEASQTRPEPRQGAAPAQVSETVLGHADHSPELT